jgi:hypothetical protein
MFASLFKRMSARQNNYKFPWRVQPWFSYNCSGCSFYLSYLSRLLAANLFEKKSQIRSLWQWKKKRRRSSLKNSNMFPCRCKVCQFHHVTFFYKMFLCLTFNCRLPLTQRKKMSGKKITSLTFLFHWKLDLNNWREPCPRCRRPRFCSLGRSFHLRARFGTNSRRRTIWKNTKFPKGTE